jgi:hypothetical protein
MAGLELAKPWFIHSKKDVQLNDSSFSYQIAMWQGINILGKNFLLYKAYGKNKKET